MTNTYLIPVAIGLLLILVGYSLIRASIEIQIEHNHRSKAMKKVWKNRGFVKIFNNGKLEKKIAYKKTFKYASEYDKN